MLGWISLVFLLYNMFHVLDHISDIDRTRNGLFLVQPVPKEFMLADLSQAVQYS
jgi:hypothetical protein